MINRSPSQLVFIAAFASGALLIGAFFFQALGYHPCTMCYWQRWPHGMAIAFAVVALYDIGWVWIAGGAISALTTSVLGLYHAGVEQKWWEGPSSCTGSGDLGNLAGSDLLSVNVNDKLVMCDQISWSFLGLSMAAWNAVLSLLIVGLWIVALVRHIRTR